MVLYSTQRIKLTFVRSGGNAWTLRLICRRSSDYATCLNPFNQSQLNLTGGEMGWQLHNTKKTSHCACAVERMHSSCGHKGKDYTVSYQQCFICMLTKYIPTGGTAWRSVTVSTPLLSEDFQGLSNSNTLQEAEGMVVKKPRKLRLSYFPVNHVHYSYRTLWSSS
jgi:hypothetical protein